MRQSLIDAIFERQDGVLSRRQVLECEGDDNDIERLVRRRIWARVHEGVYVQHTGPLSWTQRAWAAVLLHAPAALSGGSALRAHGVNVDGGTATIEIAVDRTRRVCDPPGVTTRQLTDFESFALMNLGPPRLRIEHAALTVASRATSEDAAVAVLGDACQKRRTTPARLLDAATARHRLKRRRLILDVLADIAGGTNSALERRYLVHVERAHGLPVGRRQHRVVDGRTSAYRDVDYEEMRAVFELDGRLGHDGTSDRWDDLDRDVASAVAGDLTVRLGWRQVLDPCRLTLAVAAILRARGWGGAPVPCGSGCPVTGEDPRHLTPEILARPRQGCVSTTSRPAP